MGTLSFTVTEYGQRATTIQSTLLATSGAHTTTTTASNVQDAAGSVLLKPGQVFMCFADEPMRVNFGNLAATATVGHFIPASTPMWLECRDAGLISAIDVA